MKDILIIEPNKDLDSVKDCINRFFLVMVGMPGFFDTYTFSLKQIYADYLTDRKIEDLLKVLYSKNFYIGMTEKNFLKTYTNEYEFR